MPGGPTRPRPLIARPWTRSPTTSARGPIWGKKEIRFFPPPVFFSVFESSAEKTQKKKFAQPTPHSTLKTNKQKQHRLGQPRRLLGLLPLLRPRPGPQPARLERLGLPQDEPGVCWEGRLAGGRRCRGRRGDRAGAAALKRGVFGFLFFFFFPFLSPPRACVYPPSSCFPHSRV